MPNWPPTDAASYYRPSPLQFSVPPLKQGLPWHTWLHQRSRSRYVHPLAAPGEIEAWLKRVTEVKPAKGKKVAPAVVESGLF